MSIVKTEAELENIMSKYRVTIDLDFDEAPDYVDIENYLGDLLNNDCLNYTIHTTTESQNKLDDTREHWNVNKTEALLKTEAELEATREKISLQLSMVGRSIQSIDPTLYDKERMLEHLVDVWHQHLKEMTDTREHWNVNKAEEAEIDEDLELTTYFLVYRWAHNGDSLDNGCIDSSSINVPATKTLPQAIQQFLQRAANDEFDREDAGGGTATYSAYVDRIVRIDGLNKVVDVSTYEINSHIEGIEFVVEEEENGTD